MRNSNFLGIRGIIYSVYIGLFEKVICTPSHLSEQGDLVMDGDTIKVDNKKFKVKLTERKDCSIKKIEFFAV